MFINVYSISIAFSILFLIAVLELVRKNRLQERYSLLWFVMSILLLIFSSTPSFMNTIAAWLDIKNPPSLLFLFGLVYLLVYNLHITVVVSRQSEKITSLAQETALLRQQLSAQSGEKTAPDATPADSGTSHSESSGCHAEGNEEPPA